MFGQISLYKLVHFQPPPLQLTALPQSINMVSAFCWPYTPSANKLYSHLRNISKSITVSGAACVVVVSGWVVDQVRFRAGITFAKPNEWVQIWVQGCGWEDRAQYKKRLRKVSHSDSIRSALSKQPIYYRSERWCGTGATGRSDIRLRLSIPTTEMRWSLKDVRRRGFSFSHLYLRFFKHTFNSGYVLLSNATVCVAFIRYTARVNTSNSSSIPKTYSNIK